MRQADILVFDSTMRDGEQQPMLCFRDDEKIGLCYRLVDLGIFEIDLMPSIDAHERMLMRLLNDTPLRSHLGANTMVGTRYVDQAVEVNARVAYLFCHVSDKLIQARGKTREETLGEVSAAVAYARSRGLVVDFCGGDGTRADLGYLSELLETIGSAIRFYQTCDTSGLLTPRESAEHARWLTRLLGEKKVVVHYHNDNGNSVENVIAALANGAVGFDGTFTGIGERAGNVATERVLETLRDEHSVEVEGIDYSQIAPTVEFVRNICRGVPPPQVNSRRDYPNVSGIHARALLGARDAFDLDYTPEVVESRLYFGKHSGMSNYKLLFGSSKTDDECRRIRDEVKQLSREQLRDFTATEIRNMFGRLG